MAEYSSVIGAMQIIEVRIESVERRHDNGSSSDDDDVNDDSEDPAVNVDIATRPHSDTEPLLVVFSNDRHHRHFDSRELHEMIEREMELYETGDLPAAAVATAAELADYDGDEYVDYDDDYYDNRVDAEPAERVVSRVERDTGAVSDVRLSGATAARRDLAATDETSAAATRTRVRRAKFRRRLRRSICRRRPMYVNFEDIHWNGWIIEPKGYQV